MRGCPRPHPGPAPPTHPLLAPTLTLPAPPLSPAPSRPFPCRGPGEDVETPLVHPHRQLPLLLRVHHGEGVPGAAGGGRTLWGDRQMGEVECITPHPQDKEPRGIIPLENLSIREVDDPRKPVMSPTVPCPEDPPTLPRRAWHSPAPFHPISPELL